MTTDQILRQINALLASHIATIVDLHVVEQISSTNRKLLRQKPRKGHCLLALSQTEGRGRRGREWRARSGNDLAISLAWRLSNDVAMDRFTQAIGVALWEALTKLSELQLWLKWPNDVYLRKRKLAGILVEALPVAGELLLVIGIGVNRSAAAPIAGRAVASLEVDGNSPGLAALAATVINEVIAACERFEHQGFEAFADRWQAAEGLVGKMVTVATEQGSVVGQVKGYNDQGHLAVTTVDGTVMLPSGDVQAFTWQ